MQLPENSPSRRSREVKLTVLVVICARFALTTSHQYFNSNIFFFNFDLFLTLSYFSAP